MANDHPRSPSNMSGQDKIEIAQVVTQPIRQPGRTVPQAIAEQEPRTRCLADGGTRAMRPGNLPMTVRTISRTVTFSRPFLLSGVDRIQPAGTYTVETDEELIQELSFPAYRRIATSIFLPLPGNAILAEIATIDPLELEVALERDAMRGAP